VNPDVVGDVGNSRIKCGCCAGGRIFETIALPKDPREWHAYWKAPPGDAWVVSGVDRSVMSAFAAFLRSTGCQVTIIDSHTQIPIRVNVRVPEQVGHDRLFGALAAARRYPGRRLLTVDCGTAITVNLVTPDGVFQGGAILPGLGLMARALHFHTAQLPLVDLQAPARFAGADTAEAIRAGIFGAAVGAVERFADNAKAEMVVFTGGDGELLADATSVENRRYESDLTLEGIRIAAETLP